MRWSHHRRSGPNVLVIVLKGDLESCFQVIEKYSNLLRELYLRYVVGELFKIILANFGIVPEIL
jgi:hypothetical protein